ncbi:NACHT domain-containing protein [Nonomuraea sp. NPDC048882]|uniref:NACHT domain-containing protein n=1 Tax=Nonomuraea sp. NPDC048882 TaxID=3154347 RepID=UPI0033F464CD
MASNSARIGPDCRDEDRQLGEQVVIQVVAQASMEGRQPALLSPKLPQRLAQQRPVVQVRRAGVRERGRRHGRSGSGGATCSRRSPLAVPSRRPKGVTGVPLIEERRRRWRIAAAVALAIVLIIFVLIVWPDQGKFDAARLLGLLVSATVLIGSAIGLTRWALRRRPPPAAPTDAMIAEAKTAVANLVRRQWTDEARIRALGDPHPMPVAWHLTAKRALMDHPQRIAEQELTFAGNAEDLRALTGQFRALRSRRLVITGGAGTGKTTLAVQLLLDLLATRSSAEPVPVMLSIAGWDTARHRQLGEWLTVQLAATYPTLRATEYGGDAAPAALVEDGHVLPVLDGLDELPEQARAHVITALNASLTDTDQLILTSRTTEFATAVQAAGDVVTGAAVIAPAALTPPVAATYLRTCLPPAPAHDWQPVLAAISAGTAPALATVTVTPLGLWLLRMVYILPGADPAPLLGPLGQDPKALRHHLLDQLIDALIGARPPVSNGNDPFRPRRSWNPSRTRDWLSHLAQALTRNHTRDLAWWTIARYTTTPARRHLLQVAIGLVTGLSSGLMITYALFYGRDTTVPGLGIGLIAGAVTGFRAGGWFYQAPGFLALRIRELFRILPRRLGYGLLIFAGGITAAVLIDDAAAQATGVLNACMRAISTALVSLALLGVPATVLIAWVARMEHPATLASATTAFSAWRADRNLTLARCAAGGGLFMFAYFVFVFVFLFAIELDNRFDYFREFLLYAFLFGGLGGLGAGLLGTLVVGRRHAWLACAITLWTQRRLPRRLVPFLDDMHRLGLLRTVGPLYQFRHAELHDHLAAPGFAHAAAPASGAEDRQRSDRGNGHLS